MKALTLYEPWASLVALGAKKIETRSWPTKYRGPLAIRAAKSYEAWHMNLSWEEPFYSALKPLPARGHQGLWEWGDRYWLTTYTETYYAGGIVKFIPMYPNHGRVTNAMKNNRHDSKKKD